MVSEYKPGSSILLVLRESRVVVLSLSIHESTLAVCVAHRPSETRILTRTLKETFFGGPV